MGARALQSVITEREEIAREVEEILESGPSIVSLLIRLYSDIVKQSLPHGVYKSKAF